MTPFALGASVAARSLAYHHTAEMIEADGLDAGAVARLFGFSACKRAAQSCALILLAGAVSRYRAKPDGWTRDPERAKALDLLRSRYKAPNIQSARSRGVASPEEAMRKLSEKASVLIVKAWPKIERALHKAA